MHVMIDLVRLASWLFYINSGIWLVLTVLYSSRFIGANARVLPATIAVLMLGNSVAMATAGLGIARRSRLMWWFALGVLMANIVLTFTDQLGRVDWATLALDVILLPVMARVGYQLVVADTR